MPHNVQHVMHMNAQGWIEVEFDVDHLISVGPLLHEFYLDAREYPESDFSIIFANYLINIFR